MPKTSSKPKTNTKNKTSSNKSNKSNKTNKTNKDDILTENDKILEANYKKMTQHEHVLARPDTYVGSVETRTSNELIIVHEENDGQIETKIVEKNILINPGLNNIIEEILVNAIDNWSRVNQRNLKLDKKNKLKKVSQIEIEVNKETGEISVLNNGEGIDVAKHPTEKIFIPQMIFGELLTSGNYNENEERITGGKNGFGAKLTNIYSKQFTIKTVDYRRKLLYSQTFKNNLYEKCTPKVEKFTGEPFTKVSFIPDYERFKFSGIDDDLVSYFEKRAYDILACTNGEVDVFFNKSQIKIKDFDTYISLYIGENKPRLICDVNDRWKVAACITPSLGFKHISFVNGIYTNRGGKHVDYITKQITGEMVKYISRKKKFLIKENVIKENIMVFVISTIVNPSFDSQTKETLTTTKTNFGSVCDLPTKFIEKLAELGVMDRALELSNFQNKLLLSKTDGKKKSKLLDIEKLDDAKLAGSKHSEKCTLILTEGDSAKVMAVAGISVLTNGRDYYGIYPLRGKLINTRGEGKEKQISNNNEITDIKKIMGLREGMVYDDLNKLRYGKIMIMTDQDVDGSHIKGLIINFLSKWPSLLACPGFIVSFLTPIVKVKKNKSNKSSISFYNLVDYNKWLERNDNGKGWSSKYYKGLGTSTPNEAKEYFKEFKQLKFVSNDEEDTFNSIDLAFNKLRADDRKLWLQNFNPNDVIQNTQEKITYNEFINKELIHFSNYDNQRSIPSLVDGFKPSHRKIIFCCFKRNLTKEIRVAQLAGYVSEHGAYHHGEASLQGAIIGLAQNFVGHNNINLLEPIGQFGSRLKGGKDSAQPRYIHTHLSKITNLIFNKQDMALLDYVEDDGDKVEPFYYMPIIPMILVNGSEGIGTGWSTGVPKFNPIDLIKNIKKMMNDQEPDELIPWLRGFKGKITRVNNNVWQTKGVYSIKDTRTIVITELPYGTWTDNYKSYLDSLVLSYTENNKKTKETSKDEKGKGKGKDKGKDKGNTKSKKPIESYLIDYQNECSESNIKFVLTFEPNGLAKNLNTFDKDGTNKFENIMKLTSRISCDKKLNIYDENRQLVTFKTVNDILKNYYKVRLDYYQKRKDYILNKMKNEVELISIKVKFILDIINNKIKVNNKSKNEIYEQLEKAKYPKMIDNILYTLDTIEKKSKILQKEANYDFLIKMPIYNLTKERIIELKDELSKIEGEFNTLKSKTNKDIWLEELEHFEKEYNKYLLDFYKYMDFNKDDFNKKSKKMKLVARKK